MKIAAIIAEYNPFHNGHQFQIEEIKRQTGADYVIALMSGDFVQRGAPALCNKYLRTKMALAGGVDVVLELPSLYATSSAEYFAQGGVTLLNELGIVDFLSFGSECGDIAALTDCARQLVFPIPEQEQLIADFTEKGMSYPLARQQALLQTISSDNTACHSTNNNTSGAIEDIVALLSSPNNILGLEYCKSLIALDSNMIPVTIKRKGGQYHDTFLDENRSFFASASAIRNALKTNSDEYLLHLPENVLPIFTRHQIAQNAVTEDDFSLLLHYKLLSEQETGFIGYLDCSQDLSDKIKKYLPEYQSYSQFCNLLKSKDLTYTRISRVLLHILLNIKTPESYSVPMKDRRLFVPYVRLLGFRKDASGVLSAIKKNSSIPLISNIADASNSLTDAGLVMLKQDIYTSDIYEAVFSAKSKKEPLNEYKQSPVIL